jgi:hypothetical protein
MSDQSDLKAAQDVHHRLEFYLVAVAFTVAGFAIQTGKFTGNRFGDTMEVTSWVLIVASAVLGLWRLEYIPVMYRLHHNIDRISAGIASDSSHPQYAEAQAKLAEIKPKLESMESGNRSKYAWQKVALGLGLVCLMLSRFVEQASQWYW